MLAAWLELDACDMDGIESIVIVGVAFSMVARLELLAGDMDSMDSVVAVEGFNLDFSMIVEVVLISKCFMGTVFEGVAVTEGQMKDIHPPGIRINSCFSNRRTPDFSSVPWLHIRSNQVCITWTGRI